MTRLEYIFQKAVSAVRDSINILLEPAHKISLLAPFMPLIAPVKKHDPAVVEKLAIQNFNQLFQALTDPATDPISAAALRAIMMIAAAPFTIGTAAGIVAEKNLLQPLRVALRPALLEKEEAIQALYKKILSSKEVNDILQKQGYEDKDIENLIRVAAFIPSAQDVIQFAVREVYTPETVEAFKQLEGFEEVWKVAEADVTAARMSKEDFSKFWASHWQLPAVQQAYEMLHRGFIKSEDLDRLLVAADIMPFWRDKLKSISYAVLTRVDVRRMHKLGVLDVAGVKKSYQDIGYSEKDAQLMTDFTIQYNESPEVLEETAADRKRHVAKDLTKAELINAYSDKLLSQTELGNELYHLGYSLEETAQLITLEDYKNAISSVKTAVKLYRDGFMSGAYSKDTLIIRLGKLGLPASYTQNLVETWEFEKQAKTTAPTKGEWLAWYKKRIISGSECSDGLTQLGYQDKFISYYMAENKPLSKE